MNDEQADAGQQVDPELVARARAAASGHPGLEDALDRIDALGRVDLDHLPAEFDAIHQALREALADAGQAPAGSTGDERQAAPDVP